MKCPFCKKDNDRVIDSRASGDGRIVRRRREGHACKQGFTTKEQVEERILYVIKKDGRREPFDREKIRAGLRMACKKRPVPVERMDEIPDAVKEKLGVIA